MLPRRPVHTTLLIVCLLALAGCSFPSPTAATVTQPPALTETSPAPAATPTPAPPTPTAIPAAAIVNDEAIGEPELQAELARYQQALPNGQPAPAPEEQRQAVLQSLIDEILLAQAAFEAGFTLDDAALQARSAALAADLGGPDALQHWLQANGYTEESFRAALRRSAAAAWQRDQIAATVPETADQVHVRQILVYNQADAERALSRIVPGLDFATLAYRYDPATGGDLGWFPQGYLNVPEVEAAAFAMQPEEISPIIQSALGYHILQLVERDPERPLAPGARRVLQGKAVQAWLDQRQASSQITVSNP